MDDSVRALLRGSEELKATLEAHAAPDERRVVAVVGHREEEADEQGTLMVLKPATGSNLAPGTLVMERVFPLVGDFAVSMAQEAAPAPSAFNQPQTQLAITITPDGHKPEESITLHTSDSTQLRVLLAHCKRLKDIADLNEEPAALSTYSWLAPYTAQQHLRTAPFSSTSPPPDLRVITTPLHARLSKAVAGEAGDDQGDVALIREDWLRRRTREVSVKQANAPEETLRIRVGTFNVNGKLPSQDLAGWVGGRKRDGSGFLPPLQVVSPFEVTVGVNKELGNDADAESTTTATTTVDTDAASTAESSSATLNGEAEAEEESVPEGPSDADVLVFGFQEVDLSAGALVYAADASREDAWCAAIFAGLGEKAVLYEKLASRQLVGILLVVIVKKRLRESFSDVRSVHAGAGLMGIMGNKGATAIRLSFAPSTGQSKWRDVAVPTVLTFVNAHLAAFDEMVERRNADFHDLSRRLVFPAQLGKDGAVGSAVGIYEADALFWMGDLNYRIDIPDPDVRHLLSSPMKDVYLESMQKFDQLKMAIATNKAFVGFKEHAVEHLPTYRFNLGLAMDGLGYDLKRKPAWCDRILRMHAPTVDVTQLSYASHPEITSSDHRPVSADFELKVRRMSGGEYDRVLQKLYKQVADFEEAEEAPRMSVVERGVEFGSVRYGTPVAKTIKVQNTGKIPCAYRFVSPDADTLHNPEWLEITPLTGLLLPGDTQEITLTVSVTRSCAEPLNLAPKLACTLILHVPMGKDHFVAVTGDYQPTCFGTSLYTLTRLPGSIRTLKSKEEMREEGKAVNAPREPMRVVNWLMDHANWIAENKERMQGLCTLKADNHITATVRECLDTGSEFPFPGYPEKPDPDTVLAFGEVLVQLLDSLPVPVIPYEFHEQCAQVQERDEAIDLFSDLPSYSVNVWIAVTSFLHFVAQQAEDPVQRAEHLAALFSPILLRDDPSSAFAPISPWKKRAFVMLFISL